MRFFDRITGTARPDGGTPQSSGAALRGALLSLDDPGGSCSVRESHEGGVHHLVAEWRLSEPAVQAFFVRTQLAHTVAIRMRLSERDREVRAVQEHRQVHRVGDPPRLVTSVETQRGAGQTRSVQWTIGRDENGRLGLTESFRFDTADLRDPLRAAVLAHGWTWRAVVSGKL